MFLKASVTNSLVSMARALRSNHDSIVTRELIQPFSAITLGRLQDLCDVAAEASVVKGAASAGGNQPCGKRDEEA